MAADTSNTNTSIHPDHDWYRRLMESTSAIPWEFDLETLRFTQVGPQAEPLLGYPIKDWLQKDFLDQRLHPEDRQWVLQACLSAAEKGQAHELEYRMLGADGRTVWLREVASLITTDSGKRRLQGFMFDITQHKQVEDSMQTLAINAPSAGADDFFQECVKNLAKVYNARYAFIGLLKEDDPDTVRTLAVWAGDRFADNFEYALEGTPCKDVLNLSKELIPTDAAKLYDKDELLIQMNIDSYFGAPLIPSKGKTIGLVSVMDTKPMELSPWTAPILGMFATRIAVELEKRQANEGLRELNALLEQRIKERTADLEAFSYSLSHDLRTPLRSINGFSQALLDEYGGQLDPTAQDYLHRISRSGQRMNKLIHDMLELGKLSRRTVQPCQVNLSNLAHDCLQQLQENEPNRSPQTHIEPELYAQGDPDLLRIAMSNLLQNAWKYSAKEDPAEIRFQRHKTDTGRAAFVVRDNGVGFDMRYAERLFQPFQRLHTNEEFEGSGIGLATVARVIKRHGGEIWAHAEPGQGAAFYFSLP
jgi:PAS domain S-box-containing protein